MTKKVGFWWSDKKNQKVSSQDLEVLLKEKGYDFCKIDLDAPITPQGPFDAIIHKLSDIEVKRDQGDEQADLQIKSFEVINIFFFFKIKRQIQIEIQKEQVFCQPKIEPDMRFLKITFLICDVIFKSIFRSELKSMF